MRISRYVLSFVLLTAVMLFAGRQLMRDNTSMPQINFSGRVIDEAGAPVADAAVFLSIWQVPPGWSSSKDPSLEDVTQQISLRTNHDGVFSVVDERGYMLQVLEIRKPGHVWLVDWAWSLPHKAHPDNRFFIYEGGFPLYIPDESKPAVFPLLREESTVATLPSRGGADQLADGKVVPNEPVKPVVPSTGPGTPETITERDQRLRELTLTGSTTQAVEPPVSPTSNKVPVSPTAPAGVSPSAKN